MAAIKPAEVSAILKNQLAGFEASASLDEVGTVLQVGDGIARVYGLSNAQYGELVRFDSGLEGMVLNLEEDNVGVVLLGPSNEISEGDILCFHNAGAYCFSMASNYNARFRPAEILWHESEAKLIRKEEQFDDLLHNQVVLDMAAVKV